MLEVMIISIIFGFIIGSCATLILVGLMIGAFKGIDDTEADWDGLQGWVRERRVKREAKRTARGTRKQGGTM